MSHWDTFYVTVICNPTEKYNHIFAFVNIITNPNLQYNINNGYGI